MDCLFCKIASGRIPSDIIYEDDKIVAFHDIDPQSPVHFLVIPKKHIASVNELTDDDRDLIGYIFLKIKDIVKQLGLDERGYRVVNNCGEDGQQSVPHIHFHVMAGRKMHWPAG